MTFFNPLRPSTWIRLFHRLTLAPARIQVACVLAGVLLSGLLILGGLWLHQPTTTFLFVAPAVAAPLAPPRPADFTPLGTPPPAFSTPDALVAGPPIVITGTFVSLTPPAVPMPAATLPPLPPTSMAMDPILEEVGQASPLVNQRLITILLMGKDARPGENGPSRTDTLMVAVLNLQVGSATLISIPRDLWVSIPGYGAGRINTAHFLGALNGEGPEVARQTVSQVLGLPVTYTVVVDFSTFRETIDSIGGIEIDVPEPIDDSLFPDDFYGTYHLIIPVGPQHMDGNLALAYARTRHGSSDLERAERQQAVMEAVRRRLLSPDQLPSLPSHISQAASRVETTLSLADLFFLARFARALPPARIHTHVIQPPLLWNGVTADGQQVLLYDPASVQQAVQQWLYEATQ